MAGFILLDAAPVIDNPWAAYVSMFGALVAVILGVKLKAQRIAFYCCSAICALFGGYTTYAQINLAKIDADKSVQTNSILSDLRVENRTTSNYLTQIQTEKDACLTSDSLNKIQIGKLEESNADLKQENKELNKSVKKLRDSQPKWAGTKAYNGVIPAQGNNGKWGYIDKRRNEIWPYELKKACQMHYDRGGAQKENGKWGFIDSNGFVQVDFKYDDARHFEKTKDGYVARVLENGSWYFINKSDKKIRRLSGTETAGL